MFLRIFRTLIGILFIPVAIGTGQAFYTQISGISAASGILHTLERGVLLYLIFHVMIYRPKHLYIIGHEFVHVLATWLCGGKVISFNVGRSGGSVTTTKTNFFIELSPYFVPIYTLLVGLLFFLLKTKFVFFIGLTLAFHFVMTQEALRQKQPDIVKSGMIFSLVVIFVVNLIVVMSVFCLLFKDLSFAGFINDSLGNSAGIYRWIIDRMSHLGGGLLAYIACTSEVKHRSTVNHENQTRHHNRRPFRHRA